MSSHSVVGDGLFRTALRQSGRFDQYAGDVPGSYDHARPSMLEQAAAKMDRMLGSGNRVSGYTVATFVPIADSCHAKEKP